jgi:hypothetical protein
MSKSKWQLFFVLFIINGMVSNANAEVHPAPQIGKPCPDFKLTNLVNSKKKQVYSEKNKVGFQITGAPLSRLYQYAYLGKVYWGIYNDTLYGKISPELALEISDSSDSKIDFIKALNLFNYRLYVPPGKANVKYLKQVLQRELKNCFGYEASIKNREMPCWLLQLRKETTVFFKPTNSTRSLAGNAIGMQIDSGKL